MSSPSHDSDLLPMTREAAAEAKVQLSFELYG